MKRSHPHDNNKPQISPQQQPILSAALPLLQQQHALLNLGAVNSLMQQMPGANTSSSGKRKASNPQKFTRFESNNSSGDSTTDNTPSPSVAAAVNNLSRTQVATALQFMPSFLSTMMQQHMNNAAAARNNHHHQNNSKDEVRFIAALNC